MAKNMHSIPCIRNAFQEWSCGTSQQGVKLFTAFHKAISGFYTNKRCKFERLLCVCGFMNKNLAWISMKCNGLSLPPLRCLQLCYVGLISSRLSRRYSMTFFKQSQQEKNDNPCITCGNTECEQACTELVSL